ncbi:MAG: HEAT repeat domain-containing protein [Planctomycetota bacterium]|jgi:hypothetical protein
MRLLLIVALAAALCPADDVRSPPIFFTKPDLESHREIEDLVGNNGVGAATRKARRAARAKLVKIGRWTVPYLVAPIAKPRQKGNTRIPMNAIMTLARIQDPVALPTLRAFSLRPRSNVHVRKTGCLALGLFREQRALNAAALADILKEPSRGDPAHLRAAALGLAKLDEDLATATLLGELRELDAPQFLAGSLVLAGTVRSVEAEPERFLAHEKEIVRRAAAVGLMVRPLGRQDLPVVRARLKREKSPRIRALLFYALAAMPRDPGIRELLLDCATKTRRNDDERIAAAIGLAYERGDEDGKLFKKLKPVVKQYTRRNDAVGAALMFALARTGHPDSVDVLLGILRGGSSVSRFYAGGCLLYLASLDDPTRRHEREQRIFEEIANTGRGSSDSALAALDQARGWLTTSDLRKRAELARREFTDIAKLHDRYGLHLWDRTPRDRAWAAVNRLLPALFDLDDVADRADIDNPNKTGETPLKPGTKHTGARDLAKSPEDQDLLEFLREQPYFVPEDLGGGR